MKPPAIPRAYRDEAMRDLREHRRNVDCQWPRRSGRPRCGQCFGCGVNDVLEQIDEGYRRKRH